MKLFAINLKRNIFFSFQGEEKVKKSTIEILIFDGKINIYSSWIISVFMPIEKKTYFQIDKQQKCKIDAIRKHFQTSRSVNLWMGLTEYKDRNIVYLYEVLDNIIHEGVIHGKCHMSI